MNNKERLKIFDSEIVRKFDSVYLHSLELAIKLRGKSVCSIVDAMQWKTYRQEDFDYQLVTDPLQLVSWNGRSKQSFIEYLKEYDMLELFDSVYNKANLANWESFFNDNSKYIGNIWNKPDLQGNREQLFDLRPSNYPQAGFGMFYIGEKPITKGTVIGLYGSICLDKFSYEQMSEFYGNFGDYTFDTESGILIPFEISAQAIIDNVIKVKNYNYSDIQITQFINQSFKQDEINIIYEIPVITDVKKKYTSTREYFFPWVLPEATFEIGVPILVTAAKDINNGEELYGNYGFDYWKGKLSNDFASKLPKSEKAWETYFSISK